jgi:hypothetical protein
MCTSLSTNRLLLPQKCRAAGAPSGPGEDTAWRTGSSSGRPTATTPKRAVRRAAARTAFKVGQKTCLALPSMFRGRSVGRVGDGPRGSSSTPRAEGQLRFGEAPRRPRPAADRDLRCVTGSVSNSSTCSTPASLRAACCVCRPSVGAEKPVDTTSVILQALRNGSDRTRTRDLRRDRPVRGMRLAWCFSESDHAMRRSRARLRAWRGRPSRCCSPT